MVETDALAAGAEHGSERGLSDSPTLIDAFSAENQGHTQKLKLKNIGIAS